MLSPMLVGHLYTISVLSAKKVNFRYVSWSVEADFLVILLISSNASFFNNFQSSHFNACDHRHIHQHTHKAFHVSDFVHTSKTQLQCAWESVLGQSSMKFVFLKGCVKTCIFKNFKGIQFQFLNLHFKKFQRNSVSIS